MATATPVLLCDLVYEDPVSRNITVLGMFTDLRCSRFPSPSRMFSAYALLDGDPGEIGEATLACVEDATGETRFVERQRVQIGSSGKRHIHIRCGEGFHFPRPGYYRFVLSFEGTAIGEQTIAVREVS
jgi:hypothetical protein